MARPRFGGPRPGAATATLTWCQPPVTGRSRPSSPGPSRTCARPPRPEIRLNEVPAPQRIAPYAVALTADVLAPATPTTTWPPGASSSCTTPPAPSRGRARGGSSPSRVPSSSPSWPPTRCSGVGWSWLVDALEGRGVGYVAEAGTVTRVVSQSFAGLADRPASVEMEVRASWTPLGPEVGDHLLAWSDLLCTIAGLPPLPEGVVALPGPRR